MLDRTVMIGLLETYDSFLSELFVSVLRHIEDSKPKVERKIVDFLKGKMFPVPIEKLTEYLHKSPVESLRDRVVENLWEMHSILMDLVIFIGSEGGRQPVYQPLIKMMEKEDYQHRALAMATLCSFDLPEAVNNLAASFAFFSSEMRWVIIVLLKNRWDEKFVPVFLKALEDEDPEVVRMAILAMRRATALAAMEPIRKKLSADNEIVVLTAIAALVDLGAEKSIDDFKRIINETENPRIRSAVTSAFGEIDCAEAVDILAECLRSEDPRVRANAIMALKKKYEKNGSLPDSVMGEILKLKKDRDHRVQADCIQAIWCMGLSEDTSDIESMLFATEENSRSAGAYLCGKLKLVQLKKQLEIMTADSSWNVRKMASLALLSFGDSGRAVLRNLMENGSSDQQIIAAFAFGLSDDQEAIDKLIAQSRSGGEMAEMATSMLLRLARPSGHLS